MLLVLKMTLVPLVVTLASLVARRFGTRAGGIITGLPFTAGPVSAFLAVEYGRAFAADAALAMLLSLIAIAAYAATFSLVSRRWRWPPTVAAAFAVHLSVTALLAGPSLSLALAAALALGAVALALAIVRAPASIAMVAAMQRAWELPLRIAVATSLVVAITLSAEIIGARLAGLLTTLPIIACVLAVAAFMAGGRGEAMISVRGHLIGSLSLGTFFLVVAAVIERLDLIMTYGLAIAAALAVNRIAAWLEVPRTARHPFAEELRP